MNTVYCVQCKQQIEENASTCKYCGASQRPAHSQQLPNPKATSPGNSPLIGRVVIGGAGVLLVIGLYFGFMVFQNYMASLRASAPPSSIRQQAQVQNPPPINRQSRQDVTVQSGPIPTQQDQYRQQQQTNVETRQQPVQPQQEAEAARQDQIRQQQAAQEQAKAPSLHIAQTSIKTYVGAYMFYQGHLGLEVQISGEVENIGNYTIIPTEQFEYGTDWSIQITYNNRTYNVKKVRSEIHGGKFTLFTDPSSLAGPHIDEVGIYTITVKLHLGDDRIVYDRKSQRGIQVGGPPITLDANIALPQSPTQTYAYPSSDSGSSSPPRPGNTPLYLYQVFSSGN